MRLVKWLVFFLAVAVWVGTALSWGPRLEAMWAPPLERQFTTVSQSGDTLTVNLISTKLRDCKAVAFNSAWVLSTGTVLGAQLFRADGTEPGIPLAGSRFIRGDTFTSGPWTTRIWAMVAADHGAALRLVTRYRCHMLWEVSVVTFLPLADVPVAPN